MRRLAPDGLKAWAQMLERRYEGLVAKDEAGVCVGVAMVYAFDLKYKTAVAPIFALAVYTITGSS